MVTELVIKSAGNGLAKPILSICIPAYNHERYITSCIAAIANSKYLPCLEVIVIDDLSQDSTLSCAIKALCSSSIRYSVFRNKSNQGLVYGLNYLLSNAAGEYVLFCASDDELLPDGIDAAIADILTMPIKTFTVYSALFFGDKRGLVYPESDFGFLFTDPKRLFSWISTRIPKPLLLQSTIFNRLFLSGVSPWSDGLLLDDWPTFLKVTKKVVDEALCVSFSKTCLTKYRVHSGGIHRNIERHKIACLQVVENVVSAEFRNVARSTVYSEFAVAYVARMQLFKGLSYYIFAVHSCHSLSTILSFPLGLAKGVLRRLSNLLAYSSMQGNEDSSSH